MKRFFLAMAFLMASHYVQAQASPANAGLFEAETAPEFAYTGLGWVQVVDGDYVVMESSQAGDEVLLEFDGSSIIIYRELLPLADTPATVEICLDSVCGLFGNEATENQARVPLSFVADGASPHHLSITNDDGGIYRFDYVIVMPEDSLAAASSPLPSLKFLTLDSGQIVAVDFSITGGEIAQIVFLAFLSALVAYSLVIKRTESNE